MSKVEEKEPTMTSGGNGSGRRRTVHSTSSRSFSSAAVLSVMVGRKLTGDDEFFQLLEFLTGKPVDNSNLLQISRTCAEQLRQQHPKLRGVGFLGESPSKAQIRTWLDVHQQIVGSHLRVQMV